MNRRPLKIAFIGGRGVGGTYSGIETYYEEIGSRLARRGHLVTAYCRRHFTPRVNSYGGIHVRRLPCLRSKHLETISHGFLSTLDVIGRGFDIVQYHAIGSAPLALLPRVWGRNTIVSVRGLDWQRAKWGATARAFLKACEWASARCPTATVVVSRTLQDHYAAAHNRLPHLIPNAVTPAEPCQVDRIARYGLEKDSFLLFAGRLSPEKGVHTLLAAIKPLRSRKTLVLAGASSYANGYLEKLRRDAGENVLFLGSADREVMRELYSNCYAFVLPSVMEGLSISLLEALSYGACILATGIPENLEVIGTAGLPFPPGDAGRLRDLLARVLDSPDLVRELRMRAAQRARQQPDWDEVAARTEAFYYTLANGGARARIRRQGATL